MIRSMLFLPGNSPGMLMNGDILGADAIILDLEDAVAPDEKDSARILVRNALRDLGFRGCSVAVRINAMDENGFWQQDLEEVLPLQPDMLIPPKAEDADQIRELCAAMAKVEDDCGIKESTVKLVPLIETAQGLENAHRIAAAHQRVVGLFLGAEDLTADLRCARTKEGTEIFYARTRLVAAARAAGIDAYDTPFTDVHDDEGLLEDARFAKSLGFSGKAAISPRHVQGINRVFSPTRAEIDYAHEVLEAIETAKAQGKGAISLYGKMIDAPIVSRARQVLEMHRALEGGAEQ